MGGAFGDNYELPQAKLTVKDGCIEGVLGPVDVSLIKPDTLIWERKSTDRCTISGITYPVYTNNDTPTIYLKIHETEEGEPKWTKLQQTFRISTDTPNLQLLIRLIHMSLLHPGVNRTYLYLRQFMTITQTAVEKVLQTCHVCQKKTTMRRMPDVRVLTTTAAEDHEQRTLRLHCDIAFMPIVTRTNHRYISVIFEQETGYLFVKPLSSKDEATEHVFDTINVLITHGHTISTVLSDHGTEYVNDRMKMKLKSLGITQQLSPIRSKESSGLAERAVRTAKEMVAIALETGRVKVDEWDAVVLWVEYAHNITPNRSTKKPPWSVIWYREPEPYALPLRPIVVKEEDAASGINLPSIRAGFTAIQAPGHMVEYFVKTGGGLEFREEHLRFAKIPWCTLLEWQHAFVPKGKLYIRNIRIPSYLSAPKEFQESMDKEWGNFVAHQVFQPPVPGRKVVPMFWIHSRKTDGTPKSRLVCAGNRIKFEGDKNRIATNPPDVSMLWTILALTSRGKKVAVADVSSAFLHADATIERVNVRLPSVVPGGTAFHPGQILSADKAIYGLKSAPKEFERHMSEAMRNMGAKEVVPNVYLVNEVWIYVYVDDLVLVGVIEKVQRIVSDLQRTLKIGKLKILDSEPTPYLGGELRDLGNTIEWSMGRYIQKLGIERPRGRLTLKAISCGEGEPEPSLKEEIQRKLGMIGWIGKFVPPVGLLHSILSNRALKHPCHKVLKAIDMGIADSTIHEPLQWDREEPRGTVSIYTDASHHRQSLTAQIGVIIIMGDKPKMHRNVCAFASKRVKRKVISTFVAELYGVMAGLKVYAKIGPILSMMKQTAVLKVDNQALVFAIKSGKSEDPLTSPMVTWVSENMKRLNIEIEWVPTHQQMADGLTKFHAQSWVVPR